MFNRIVLCFMFSSIQIVLYYLVLRISWNVGSIFHEPTHQAIASGMTLIFSVYVFAAVVAVQNVIDAIVNRKSLRLWLLISAIVVFASLWIPQWNHIPVRIILIISSGSFVLLLKFFIQRVLEKNWHSAQGMGAV